MSKTWKPDKMRWTHRRQSLGAWVFVGLGLAVPLAGCSTTPSTHSGDPLFGEYYPKGPNGQPMPAPNPSAQKTTSLGVPPYPTANSASSTAAIASNTTLPGERPLAINERNAAGGTWTNTTTPAVPAGNSTPVPQPIPRDTSGPVAVANPVPPAPAPSVSPAPATNVDNASSAAGTIIPTASWSTPAPTPASAAPPPPSGRPRRPNLCKPPSKAKGLSV